MIGRRRSPRPGTRRGEVLNSGMAVRPVAVLDLRHGTRKARPGKWAFCRLFDPQHARRDCVASIAVERDARPAALPAAKSIPFLPSVYRRCLCWLFVGALLLPAV